MNTPPSPIEPVSSSTKTPRGRRTGHGRERALLDEQPDLRHYLLVLWEKRWLLFLIIALFGGGAFFYSNAQPRMYETRASILVEINAQHILGSTANDLVDPTPVNFYMVQDFLQTSRRVLVSDTLARRAVMRMRLLQEPSFFAPGPLPTSVEEAAEALLGCYSTDVIPETRVLVVNARHREPQWAKKVADAIADEFVYRYSESRESHTQRTTQQLSEELDVIGKSLRDAEMAVFQFKSQHELLSVSLEDRQNQVARQIDKYSDALSDIKLRKLQRQSQLESLRALKDADPRQVPISGVDVPQLLGDLRRTYVEEQRRLAELRSRYEDRHPQVASQSSKVEQLLLELRREVTAALGASELRLTESERDEKRVSAELALLKQEGLRISRLEIEHRRLKRDAENLQKQHELLLSRTNVTGMAYRLALSNIKVMDYARVPKVPVSPRTRMTVAMAILVALLLGWATVFVMHALDRTIKKPEDIETALGLTLLGRLPKTAGKALSDQYVKDHPRSPLAEAFRALRTSLLFFGADKPLRLILVTSSVAKEGKTLACASLGVTWAQTGAKTLLIDCDLRRPRLASAFGLRPEPGLTSVLALDADLETAVRPTEVPNLWVLPSGPIPPNPAELLEGEAFRRLLARLGAQYDRVLLDSPPAVPVTDAAILATSVDGVLLLVRQGLAQKDLVAQVAEQIASVGGHLLGVIVNAVQGRGRQYRAYYGEYAPPEGPSPAASPGSKPAR